VHGELDIATAPRLREQIDRLRRRGRTVIVDLSAVTFMDSTGLAMLMSAQEAGDAALTLRRPSAAVRRVFELAGLGRLLGE
jgi:anti-sigma B factor antagonist